MTDPLDPSVLEGIVGFDWDRSNLIKNQHKHLVDYRECEEAFFNRPLKLYQDSAHSKNEQRMHALGITSAGRRLFIAFTLRRGMIRVISVRDQHKKERSKYETV